MYYLLLTGNYPTDAQFKELSDEWKHRGNLTKAELDFIISLPR